MAATINPRVVLRAMLEHPTVFPVSQNEIEEAARKALPKELKSKTIDLSLLKQIFIFAHEENIKILIDEYQPTDVAGLIKKIDPNSKYAKVAQVKENLLEARAHVISLANGIIGLTLHAPALTRTPATPRVKNQEKKNKSGDLLESKVHSGKAKATRSKAKT